MTRTEYETVDTHTAGMPTRVVHTGLDIPSPPSDHGQPSVRVRRDEFGRRHDDVREFLICEPRGHDDMFGAVPLEPGDPSADVGLFFMDTDGYLDMCGHATIGAITALVETGALEPDETVVVETPAGLVTTDLTIADGRVETVTFENVPSAYAETRTVHAGQHGSVDIDVVSAGNICGLIDADAVGLSLAEASADRIADVGMVLRDLVNEAGDVTDPITGRTLPVTLIEFMETGDPNRTAVVFGDGAVDRSPCGTGTSARMTLCAHRGDLAFDDRFSHVGPTRESFDGRVLDETDGVYRTAVTGSAHVTGHHTFVRHERDGLDAFTLD